jgi:hypothetical protein
MESDKPRLMQGTVRITYPEATVAAIADKYSFSFKMNGAKCHCGNKGGKLYVQGMEREPRDLDVLVEGLMRLVGRMKAWDDELEVVEFLCKYMKMNSRITRELRRLPISEGHLEASDLRPIDNLSFEQQCLAETFVEQVDKDNRAGRKVHTITKEMVDAKIEEKKRQQDRKKR